jgi:hypothetical protein
MLLTSAIGADEVNTFAIAGVSVRTWSALWTKLWTLVERLFVDE